MASWSCSICDIKLPHANEFTKCPKCLRSMSYAAADPDYDESEARSLQRHHDFERYYANRTAEKLKRDADLAAQRSTDPWEHS